MRSELPPLKDDGLATPTVGEWSEVKYAHVAYYAGMFSTSMKNKWSARVYIDLFAGAGRAQLKDTRKIVEASPLIALNVADSFSKYFFCEQDQERLSTLKKRVAGHPNSSRVTFIEGDINSQVRAVLSQMPDPKKTLSFCFADPFRLENLKFATIRSLAELNIDFLILVPSFMDANRNPKYYLKPQNKTVEEYLDDPRWRVKWSKDRQPGSKFGLFILERFKDKMASLNFMFEDLQKLVEVRSSARNLPLYHLPFYSRSELALKFWTTTKKYSDHQGQLF